MKTKSEILYGLKHPAWNQYKKSGRTTRTIKITNMQTSLFSLKQPLSHSVATGCDIDITNELLDCYFYEYLMKQILKNYNMSQHSETKVALDRIKPNKEMFNVDNEDIEIIFNFFNELNNQFDTTEKLKWYIQTHHPEYFNKKRNIKNTESSSSSSKKKLKKCRGIYVVTSY